ncbi:MAG: class I SAM-dependent methyltransferase [Calditrichaeota bacterium]|nr:MAG: class I SAM-dependent methyltransferase [Calditrichota bacterium]
MLQSISRFYHRYILPRLIHWTCGLEPLAKQREKLVPLARGLVLEVGIGSGHNLPYYRAEQVQQVIGIDPSREVWQVGARERFQPPFPVHFVQASASALPLKNQTVDTVLITYALCTIPQVPEALQEMRRVLRPGGQLLFCEHGLAPDASVAGWQHRLTPLWKPVSGGCHLNRNMPELIRRAGFRLESLETGYLPGWKPASYNFWGRAVPAESDP